MNDRAYSEILSRFSLDLPVNPFGNGHINSTFRVGEPPQYILQKINTNVFTDPDGLMENVTAVTEHLRKKIAAEGGDPDRETLTFLPTATGAYYYRAENGECWRVYRFVGDSHVYEAATPELFAQSAKAFGHFQKLLSDFPADRLHETIPRFHDTGARLEQLREAIAKNKSGRADEVGSEIEFAFARAGEADTIVSALQTGKIPLRVTHNDTKLNNVLFDDRTNRALCVIDLDTVMPGSLLYDYGDALRFGASTAAEDETDLEKVRFDFDLFRAYTNAYLEALSGSITEREIALLPTGAKLITLECGMRFLADYINGDVYFRIHREKQNLDRARTQFKLVADMESKWDEMQKIVAGAKAAFCK